MSRSLRMSLAYMLSIVLVLGGSSILRANDCAAGCDDGCGDCGVSCAPCAGTMLDNTTLFIAGDAWKNMGDLILSNNQGYRIGANTALGIGNNPIRFQVGGSYGAYNLKGRLPVAIAGPTKVEEQLFITGGFFKRSNVLNGERLAWGVVYDHMHDTAWGAIGGSKDLGQIRYMVGWARDAYNEFGISGSAWTMNDITVVGFPVRPINQVNMFWHHTWQQGGDTNFFFGWAEDPASCVVGANGRVPLNDRVALFGNTTYYVPSAATGPDGAEQDTWNVSIGLSVSLGGKAINRTVSGNAGMPLFDVADNGTFGVQY